MYLVGTSWDCALPRGHKGSSAVGITVERTRQGNLCTALPKTHERRLHLCAQTYSGWRVCDMSLAANGDN